MPGSRQHFLPAALIGGFGHARGPKPRHAVVLWRCRDWAAPKEVSAESIGFVNGLYRLDNPPPGTDRNRIDRVWNLVEPHLPGAIGRLEQCRHTDDDLQVLINYVATAGVRHPDFEPAVNRWLAEQGRAAVRGDQLQVARMASLADALLFVRSLRWRVLHSPKRAQRFILSDRGWTYIGQEDRDGRGLFIPLNGRVALLAWQAGRIRGGYDHQELRPSWVRWLNAATWAEAPQFVVGSPGDAGLLTRISTPDEVGPTLDGRGPFRRSHQLMFDEA